MNVKFYIIQDKDGKTAAERFAEMTKENTSFYAVDDDLFFGEVKLTNDADLQEIAAKIGTVPDGDDLVSMIMDASYDDTDLAGRVTDNENAIALLNKTDGTVGSVKKTVDDAIAAIIASAPESFDTLKEISDWISTHTTDAASMNSAISANTAAIGHPSVEADPDEGIVAQDATGLHADIEGLESRVETLETAGSGSGASTATQVTVADAGNHFNGTNVEAVLAEIADALTWQTY